MIQIVTPTEQDERLQITAASADFMVQFAESASVDWEHWMSRVEQFIRNQDDWAAPGILADLEAAKREYKLAASGYRELIGLIVAAAEASREVIAQRDAALDELEARPDAGQMYDQFVALLAERGALPLDDARRATYILFATDAEVLDNAVVDGLDALQRFRDGFRDIVDELKTRRIER